MDDHERGASRHSSTHESGEKHRHRRNPDTETTSNTSNENVSKRLRSSQYSHRSCNLEPNSGGGSGVRRTGSTADEYRYYEGSRREDRRYYDEVHSETVSERGYHSGRVDGGSSDGAYAQPSFAKSHSHVPASEGKGHRGGSGSSTLLHTRYEDER
uniref:Uncharacterized protein n=2 Tax=Lygus hesperus TaxID=30085 RepID=A0A146LE94_LYGHE